MSNNKHFGIESDDNVLQEMCIPYYHWVPPGKQYAEVLWGVIAQMGTNLENIGAQRCRLKPISN